MNSISYIIILYGAIFSFLHGIEQITGKVKKTQLDYISSIVMITVAIILYNHAILSTNRLLFNPNSLFFYLTSIYAIGPLNYFYYYSLINNQFQLNTKQLLHLLPALVIGFIECMYYAMPVKMKHIIINSIYAKFLNPFSILLVIGGTSFVIYQLYFLYQCINALKTIHNNKGLYLAIFLESINILTPLPIMMWLITKEYLWYAIAGYMTTFVIIVLFLLNRRFPYLFHTIADAIKKSKYERNYLSNINQETLLKQLMHLMTTEKIFTDPDISLFELSKHLNITPHQLSQFINKHLNMRFNHFVNIYRIEEAKNILANHPDANIISIAFHVGFNSKSTFNKLFKQYTGKTPSDYKALYKNHPC